MNIVSYQIMKGFTLAELLIVMAVLGIIATFTLPKVLLKVQENEWKAKKIEISTTLASVVNEGVMQNILLPSNSYAVMKDFFFSKINAVKYCNLGKTEGCVVASKPLSWWDGSDFPAIVMHSGATIQIDPTVYSSNHWCSDEPCVYFTIDVNGDFPPNEVYKDTCQIAFTVKGATIGAGRYATMPSDAGNGFANRNFYEMCVN